MAIVINREVAGDLNNPTPELLDYCIQEHAKELKRLDSLSDYYDGKQEILKRTKESNAAPNNKIMVNHAKYVVDMNVGFMVSNPIAYSAAQDQDISEIMNEYDRVDIVSHDTELEKDLSTFGVGYELIYLKKAGINDTQTDIKCIDPRGVFLVTDDTIDKNPLFAVHYQPVYDLKGGVSHWTIKYYGQDRIITYKSLSKADGNYEMTNAVPHYFGRVPIIEYRNNEEKQGDFEQALTLIDAYNILQSDRLNDKEAFVDAILFIQGFSLEDGAGQQLQEDKILQAPGDKNTTAAGYLTKELNEDGVTLLRSSLLDDIHKITYVPNMNDEKFSGNVSGEAMKYKLFGLLQLMSVKSRYMIKGLRQRLEIFAHIENVKGKAIDVTGTKIKLKPNLPINTSDIVNQIVSAHQAGILPLKLLLSWLPDIDDVEEVLEQLKIEKEEAVKLQQEAMGTQSEDSHSDLDDEPEEEIDDDNSNVSKEK
ncbi:phage portal protein [Enterococcus sp. 5H]|uniref:phage portal protein n=1 Tax=Enterococcus sp. 5H TaxID=1229490 RepID=UPI0023044DBA|nr:phage portal protein [Enterococcus sp. 5H]MDA9472826.1 Phage portal [Enterococcus sp. 5H]